MRHRFSSKKVVDAAQVLGMRRREIKKLFEERGQGKLYNSYLRRNKFQPFTVSEGMEDAYKELAKKHGIANPLNRGVKKRIKKIIKRLKKQKLNTDYIVKESDWVSALPGTGAVQTAQRSQTPMPATPGVSPQLMTQGPQNITQTGLTHTENALLSNEEKAMRLRQRGQG